MSYEERDVMYWSERAVLVTGAGGFIGSHLTERLVELGAKVTAFVRYNSRNDWGMLELLPQDELDEIRVVMGDLKDSDAVRHVSRNISTIIHLGSLIAIPYSYVHPREVIETNVMGILNILVATLENDVEKIVHTSTSEVYGTAQYVPMDERHPLQGQSPYSASKIGADMIAESFWRSFGAPVAIIRPFNTFGPRQSARAVIPTIISQALTKDRILLGSLTPTRDYTYIDDVVEAFISAAESPSSIGEVTNIGSNFEISMGDIAEKVISMIGKQREVVLDPKRLRPEESEVERLWCDNRKAKKLLGWEPKVGFDEGLKKTIKWITDHADLYKPELYVV
jgi:NAD dependent epimerase/dehydratase